MKTGSLLKLLHELPEQPTVDHLSARPFFHVPNAVDHLPLQLSGPGVGHVVVVHERGRVSEPDLLLRVPLHYRPAQPLPPGETLPEALDVGLVGNVVVKYPAEKEWGGKDKFQEREGRLIDSNLKRFIPP